MKKLLVFILLCVSSTIMFAQQLDLDLYYTASNEGCAAFKTYMTSLLYINEVEQKNGNLEVGVFDQDGVCRGAKLPKYRANKDYWYYQIEIYGDEGFSYTFKVYDHVSESELDLTMAFPDDEITWGANKKYGSLSNLYFMNFTQEGGETVTVERTILGYEEGSNGGYYLIASPFDITPDEDNGLLTSDNNFDLYYFSQGGGTDGRQWVNFKDPFDGNFNLEPGKGYLYANLGGTTLSFTGTPSAETVVPLSRNDEVAFGSVNLIGNPLATPATVNKLHYVMNDEGTDCIEADETVAVQCLEGIFVLADDNGEPVTFTQSTGTDKGSSLALSVSKGHGVIDRAAVNFGEGQLAKFQLRDNSTKLYIPKDNKDFAVVTADNQGELPVNFKAETNGTYNITLSTRNAEFSYLHLIDNLTGNDVDLLVNPSYSFDANNTDYASRFKLVFAKGTNNSSDNFGFISNGNLLILGIDGEATLQLTDITGRTLSSETFSGSYNKPINAAAGVYTLRLIQGSDVRTQKIVVK